jgi:Zn-dependent metalloprotease
MMGNTTKTMAAFVCAALSLGTMAQGGGRLAGATVVSSSGLTNLPYFVKLNPSQQMRQDAFTDWAVYSFNVPASSTFKAYKTETDELGYTHTRYQQYMNGYPVEGTQVIAHAIGGKVTMVNGDYYQQFSPAGAALTEKQALGAALKKVHAEKYMWEDPAAEAHERMATGNSSFRFYPKGEMVYVHKKDADYSANNMRLAYKFDIYAEVPLYRAYVYIDAATGEILEEQNRICTFDVVGTAVTKYSGTKTMTSDNNGGTFRLRETGRGGGVQTYNLQNGTSYGSAVDFTNGSATWTNTGFDQAATDAHWGAEMTYDYYMNNHGRNSIDGSGYMLRSYVHYSTSYVNAFWNGQVMTYGDGNGTSYNIMTALDVCGHEITHGLISATANLAYQNESGALNESFADIFGNSIENFARPTQYSWRIGEDLTSSGQGLRSMSNPGLFGDPDTYMAGSYYTGTADNGGVHTNSGVSNYWYYLLVNGGSGTNDLGNAFSVTGQGWTKGSKIAFRGLTVYFTSGTQFANARALTEQAAVDLYGNCSPELTATSNAWYAVGVGSVPTTGSPSASFSTGSIATCSMPVTVNFTNNSTGSQSYSWNFGNGATSTQTNPAYTYTAAGTYTVTLTATGCGGSQTNNTSQVITVGSTGAALPLSEGFEGLTTIPNGWSLSNPNSDATWEINSTVAKTGTKCMGMNNCDGDGSTDMTGRIDQVYTKSYNFSNVATVSLTFDIAYAQLIYQGTPYNDQLDVLVSTNCGSTWTNLYSKAGATLASAPSYTSIASCWVPASAAQWRNDVINLNAYAGQPNVQFAFKNTSAWGTWIYIDNINITGTTGVAVHSSEAVSVFPNPAHNNLNVVADKDISSINIIDMLGKTVFTVGPQHEKSAQVDISSLPGGIYFVKVSAGDAQKLIRLVKE